MPFKKGDTIKILDTKNTRDYNNTPGKGIGYTFIAGKDFDDFGVFIAPYNKYNTNYKAGDYEVVKSETLSFYQLFN